MVESGTLLRCYTGNCVEGSNPSLSAKFQYLRATSCTYSYINEGNTILFYISEDSSLYTLEVCNTPCIQGFRELVLDIYNSIIKLINKIKCMVSHTPPLGKGSERKQQANQSEIKQKGASG